MGCLANSKEASNELIFYRLKTNENCKSRVSVLDDVNSKEALWLCGVEAISKVDLEFSIL